MKCAMCENTKNLKKHIINYKYTDCGLDNVTLVGITSYRCNECGEEFFNFGDISNLHNTISELIIKKANLLIGSEIRFLRKNIGYSGAMFANLIGYAHESLSRIENEQQAVTESFDRLVRFAVVNKMPDRNYELHDLILNRKGNKLTRIKLKQTANGHWSQAKAA